MSTHVKEVISVVGNVVNRTYTETTEFVVNLDPFYKISFILYLFAVILATFFNLYIDGVDGLFRYRQDSKYKRSLEWSRVKEVVMIRKFDRFIESLILPWTMITAIIPTLVIWLNPSTGVELESTQEDNGEEEVTTVLGKRRRN